MPSSGMLHRGALVRIDDSEERSTSIIRVSRIGKLGTTLGITSMHVPILDTLIPEALLSS
jgi:hypothetical protein